MSRKDPYFSFKDRDSVEYKPQYGTAYTPRQEKILSGELPLEDIRPNELSLLKQKAKHLGDMEGYEIATCVTRRCCIHWMPTTITTPPRKRRKSFGS